MEQFIVCMLRGINVGGHRTVRMDDLRGTFQSLGFDGARSYLQSGNLVFKSPDPDIASVQRKIEAELHNRFGSDVVVFLRTGAALRSVVEKMPFRGRDETKLHVTFLSDRPRAFPAGDFDRVKDNSEEFYNGGMEVYLFLPNGYGRTKLTNNYFEGRLKVHATTRNWKTVTSLLAMTSG